jgi:DNA-binding MarR family transcriptional regulator
MGRQFDVSRQAASKIVAELRELGYVEAAASATDRREKVVKLTPKAVARGGTEFEPANFYRAPNLW